jgi:phosphatidylglycerol---prolipoprotein diacylglyceryl transferase
VLAQQRFFLLFSSLFFFDFHRTSFPDSTGPLTEFRSCWLCYFRYSRKFRQPTSFRLYHLLVHSPIYLKQKSMATIWDLDRGGGSVFGALITFIPASFVAASWLNIPAAVLWDHMGVGVLAGGFWIRLGCVFNGCCVGRAWSGPLSVRLHDTHGVTKPRVPVQFLEMAWWLVGLLAFLLLWSSALRLGSYALAVLAWYGVGRFFLEPLREHPDLVFGRIRINQVVAAVLALGAGCALIVRDWPT